MRRQLLSSLCEMNPETLDSSTPVDFEFRYLDISSVTKGQIDWSATRVWRFTNAPSRARRVLRRDDVLLCTVRPGLQAHARIATDGTLIGSTGFAVLRPHAPTDSGFIFHQLFSEDVTRQLRALETGSNYPAINESDVRQVLIFAPEPTERERIVEVLDTLDEAILKTEALIAKLKQVRAGLLHDLVSRGLDEHGQLRDPIAHPEQFQDSLLGQIPTKWRVVQLREVAEVSSGVTLGRNLSGVGTLELPYLRVANVQDGYLDLMEVKTVRVLPEEVERFRLRRGDVLLNEGGDSDKLGRGTVWEDQIPLCLHQNHVFRVRCNTHMLNCYFLAAVSASAIGKGYFLRSSKQSTNLASINSSQLNAFEIPLPNLAEQEAVVRVLQDQETQLLAETKTLAKLHSMKFGLMSDLLTGRVRVPGTFGG